MKKFFALIAFLLLAGVALSQTAPSFRARIEQPGGTTASNVMMTGPAEFPPAIDAGQYYLNGVIQDFHPSLTISGTPTYITLDALNQILTLLQVDLADSLDVTGINAVIRGGTGASSLTAGGVLLGSGTGAITPLAAMINGQLVIGSTGVDPVVAALTGTANQIIVVNGGGIITLSGPQDIHTGASPTFVNLTATADVNIAGALNGPTDDSDFEIYATGSYLVVVDSDDDEAKLFVIAVGTGGIPDGVFVVDESGTTTIDGALEANGTADSWVLGNLGVRIASPATIFDVNDDAVTGTGLLVTGGGSGGPMATFTRDVGSDGLVEISAKGGDPQIAWDPESGGTVWSIGVDDSDSDKFKIGTGIVAAATAMTIDANLDVGFGDITPENRLKVYDDIASAHAAKIHNDGNNTNRWGLRVQAGEDAAVGTNRMIGFYDGNGSLVGDITWNGTVMALNSISSRARKINIGPMAQLAIPVVSGIQVRDWDREYDATQSAEFRGRGFVAEELELMYPRAVYADAEGNKLVSQMELIPLLLKSAQEMASRIGALENDIRLLQMRNMRTDSQ